jgi:membrane protein DedA with SNARE-associated domain
VAQGRIDFAPAVLACCAGVYVGDLGLFLAGRWFGRGLVERRPLSWFVTPAAIDRASAWFRRQGLKAIFLSRLMPGLRLPTYFAAGVLRTRLLTFALYFLVAVLVWTPLLALFAAWVGAEALGLFERWGALALLLVLVLVLFLERVVLRLFTFRGRRSLRGAWLRWTRWEFWPPWLFYPPVVLYVLRLALKHRSLALVTAVNPAIFSGGIIGESKSRILDGLRARRELLAPYVLIAAAAPLEERLAAARAFQAQLDPALPIVLKPEVGQRGSGVRILQTTEALEVALRELEVDHVLQRYVSGPEYGVFYLREAGAARGRLFSIAEKRLPEVVGDGRHTLEQLILLDPRAVALAQVYLERHAPRLQEVPEPGRRIRLVELGTHCRGAIFLDAEHLRTPELEAVFEELSAGFEGFHFGRYDLRAESQAAFCAGRAFAVLELNGVTSEAAHIYDPRASLRSAYRVLFEQWRLAFEIAAANRDAGARPTSLREVLREFRRYRAQRRSHRN